MGALNPVNGCGKHDAALGCDVIRGSPDIYYVKIKLFITKINLWNLSETQITSPLRGDSGEMNKKVNFCYV